jgi:hypothetical protein
MSGPRNPLQRKSREWKEIITPGVFHFGEPLAPAGLHD